MTDSQKLDAILVNLGELSERERENAAAHAGFQKSLDQHGAAIDRVSSTLDEHGAILTSLKEGILSMQGAR